MRVSLLLFITTTLITNLVFASSGKGQQMEKVQVRIELKGESFAVVAAKVESQTPFTFLYRNEDVSKLQSLSFKDTKMTVSTLLTKLLQGSNLTFKQIGKRIVINKIVVPVTITEKHEDNLYIKQTIDTTFVLIGKVTDSKTDQPIAGATITTKQNRVITDSRGVFKIEAKRGALLKVSHVGYEEREITLVNFNPISISLQETVQAMKEIVVNGMFTRKAESFTGAVSTFSGAELKRVGNINVLQSLAVLDPSFHLIDNTDFGSDPNHLPETVLRGATGVPNLNATYANAPNLPLFILDGFESTIERIYDLNMNMVASITILKDASAKAIYGSKAGNGVVVIETKKPVAGNLRISYVGSVDVTAPDLSSYHLTNSMQKIQAEQLAGKYTSAYPELQYPLTQQYTANMQQALSGVDTYWLSQPLQNGIGQKHNLLFDGGSDAIRYSAGINYNDNKGVMKGSDRNTLTGVVNLSYRKNKVAFNNSLTIDKNKATNSPYGDFSAYAKMNPYWKIYDNNGNIIPSYQSFNQTIYNPLYDATLNTINSSQYTTITENFYGEWEAKKNLRLTARLGVTDQTNNSDYFLPATATEYMSISPASADYLNRGQYTLNNGKKSTLSSDIGASYSFTFGKSQVYSNLFASVQQNKLSTNGQTMVGFPNDKLVNIAFGNQYLDGSKAVGTESTSRNLGVTSALNYAYDNRFLADFSFRTNASSLFGANKQWGNFWSAGLGWNVHHEKFMKSLPFIDQLKLRGSVGTSGTQNFETYQSISSYTYITDQSYNGDLGLKLLSLANPNLKWQQVQDNNVGIDASFFNKLSVRFDYYINDTKDLLSDQTVAPSSGFATFKANVGEIRNRGFQLNLTDKIYSDASRRIYLSVFANVAHNTNKVRKVAEAFRQINQQEDAILNGTNAGISGQPTSKPVTRFAEGQSLSAIWAVRSLGIDPANGKEIFVKRDGTQTYLWSADDQVVVGDNNPAYNGSFGTNLQYHNFSLNFAFSYRLGGQMYNTTLVNQVENADLSGNVDVRVLDDRWKVPGQQSFFKNIADNTVTKPTSRFVQDDNQLLFSSVNLGYDFSRMKFVKRLKMSSFSTTLNMNDLGRITSVKTERGLSYPYARTISLSLQATF